jgi:hypothetical protein
VILKKPVPHLPWGGHGSGPAIRVDFCRHGGGTKAMERQRRNKQSKNFGLCTNSQRSFKIVASAQHATRLLWRAVHSLMLS